MALMQFDDHEKARLQEVMAPVEERILKLIDAAAPAQRIFGRMLAKQYEAKFKTPLDPQKLTGQTDLRAMLGRRNLVPRLGVKGPADGWYVYRIVQSDGTQLDLVQDRILQLIKDAPKPELVDGHGLQSMYGDKYKQKLEYRAFGCKNLRELIEKCDRLKVRMKNDKMYVRPAAGLPGSEPAAPTPGKADASTTSVREAKRAAKRQRDGPDAVVVPKPKKTIKKKVAAA